MSKQTETIDSSLFELDENELDREWLSQPKKYFKYAMLLAEARRDMEKAKSQLELTDAELDHDIRKNPHKYEVEKITETVVVNTIIIHDDHIEAERRYLRTKHSVDVYGVAVNTLEHTKKALENLVTLHLANYYSSPKEKKGERKMSAESGEKRVVRKLRSKEDDD